MKKLLIAILLLIGLKGYGQTNRFPSIDSAKAYVLRFMKTSAVEAFTNYRLQNVQYGTLELIDSIGSSDSLKVDSVTVKVNTDSMFYWIGSTNHFIASLAAAAAGGDTTIYSVILDSTGQANRRVLFAKNSKIASESRFLYDDTNHKLVINNPNISVDGTATKLFVNGNTTTSNLKIQNLATSNDTTANKILIAASDGTVKKANWNNSGGGGGGGFATADNYLTASTSTNVQLGGPAAKNTTLDFNSKDSLNFKMNANYQRTWYNWGSTGNASPEYGIDDVIKNSRSAIGTWHSFRVKDTTENLGQSTYSLHFGNVTSPSTALVNVVQPLFGVYNGPSSNPLFLTYKEGNTWLPKTGANLKIGIGDGTAGFHYPLEVGGNGYIGGTLKIAGITSGAGTKQVRVNPTTGLLTYVDTTLQSSTSLNNIGTGYDVAVQNTANVKRLQAGTGGIILDSATSGVVKISSNGTAQLIQKGTYAQRIALTPDTGQIFYQTDRLSGQWYYDGEKWNFNGSALNYIYYDQFGSSTAVYGGYNRRQTTGSGTGNIIENYAGLTGLDNVLYLSTGTTTNGFAILSNLGGATNTSGTVKQNLDSVHVYTEYKFYTDSLGTVGNDFNIFIGIPTATNTFDYPYLGFKYNYNTNGGNWQTITSKPNTGDLTTKNSNVPLRTNQWNTFAIEIDGYTPSVKFYINDTLIATHIAPDTIPFPIQTRGAFGYGYIGIVKVSGTVERHLYVDHVFGYMKRKKY